MSIKIITKVWDDSTHTGTALLAMLALADHSNDEGYSWPGVSSLAHKVRVGWRQCVNVLQTLEASGEVFIDRGTGRNTTSKYLVTLGLSVAEIADRLNRFFDCPKSKAIPLAQAIYERMQRSSSIIGKREKVQRHVKRVQSDDAMGEPDYQKGAIATSPEPSLTVNSIVKETKIAATAAPLESSPQIQTQSEPEGEHTNGTSSPLQQSPIDDDVPPAPPPPVVKPKAPRTPDPVFDRLCTMTESVAAIDGGMIGKTRQTINKDEKHPCTVANLDLFMLWWCSADNWRKKSSPVPELKQMPGLWGKAMAWAEKHAPRPAPIVEQLSPEDAAALEARLMAEYEAREAEMNRRRIAAGYIKA